MELVRIIGVGLVTAVLSLLVRQHRPELALALPMLGSAALFLLLAPRIQEVLELFRELARQAGIEYGYFRLVVKIIGVAYLGQFAAELCRDAGESSLASKLELAGKVLILTLSLPIIRQLMEMVAGMIDF